MITYKSITNGGWLHSAGMFLLSLTVLMAVSVTGVVNAAGKGKLEFAIIGDAPYNAKQRQEFVNMMEEIDAADLGFVVHAGDYWFDGIAWKPDTKGLPPCSDEVYQDRLAMAKKSRHAFIITPGDNDWTDCHRSKPKAYDPIDRLEKFRKMFYQGDRSLGQQSITLVRQSANAKYSKYRENARWTYGGALFVTLHMVGSNNNLGRTEAMDKEYRERNDANIAWLQEAFDQARRNGSKAIMIIAQANPQFETTWTPKVQKRYMLGGLGIKPPKEKRHTGFDDFIMALEEYTLAFGKPVVYVHGDTHTFRMDKPLLGSTSRRIIENFTRVETFGFPDTHWVKVTIDPKDPNVFSFHPQIVNKNRVAH